ncbi:MAG: PQQ-binding-like beta-propeller repeat protein [Rhodopirellula sp.]|nr:PQQ-binding-like beta-propeller repeat protein [Rhodopirellula sp.]
MTDQNSPTEISKTSSIAPRRGILPPIWVWVVVLLLAILVIVVRATGVAGDPAATNVASAVLVFLAGLTFLVWFLLFSGYGRRLRLVALLGLLTAIAAGAAVFRVDRISGELIPGFALRFSPKPDERLEISSGDIVPGSSSPVDMLTTTAEDFPEFLGPSRRMSVDGIELARDWVARPPQRLWRRAIGAGWSAFSVVNGHAVTMEQRGRWELVVCYDLTSGTPQWSHSIATRYESISGGVGPRSTPSIDEGMVYALGAMGHLVCLDGANGECRWRKNLLEQYGIDAEEESKVLPWARSNSPLIVDDLVIVPASGPRDGRKVSLVAYDKRTGDLVWEGGDRQISYSSPTEATLDEVRQIINVNEDSVSGHDIESGRVLWEHPWPARSNADPNVSQPMVWGANRLLLSRGYGGGAAVLELKRTADGGCSPEVVWINPRVLRTKFTTAAVKDGYAYGLSDGILECVDLNDGRTVWKDGRYRHGQILMVRDLILVLAESGEVVLVEATPQQANHVLGRFQAIEGITWNNIALYGPYLLVRNAEQAACYELPLAR